MRDSVGDRAEEAALTFQFDRVTEHHRSKYRTMFEIS
jgi:hypothetical protein